MNKLTREQIQALNDDELNELLIKQFYKTPDFTVDYCNSLDAQFELAEKFNTIAYTVDRSPANVDLIDNEYMFTIRNLSPLGGRIQQAGKTKRTGAELLLEAIQELEEVR